MGGEQEAARSRERSSWARARCQRARGNDRTFPPPGLETTKIQNRPSKKDTSNATRHVATGVPPGDVCEILCCSLGSWRANNARKITSVFTASVARALADAQRERIPGANGIAVLHLFPIFRPFFPFHKNLSSSVISGTFSRENRFPPKPKKRPKIAKHTKHEPLPKRDAISLKFP